MHWCDGVEPFETLKRILRSVRDHWNKLGWWERLVHMSGLGKWESEFQEGSLFLITQNFGFIYKNTINDFFIYIKITICMYIYICLLFLRVWKKLIYWIFLLFIYMNNIYIYIYIFTYLFICGNCEIIHRNNLVPIWYRNISFQLTNRNGFWNGIHNIDSKGHNNHM